MLKYAFSFIQFYMFLTIVFGIMIILLLVRSRQQQWRRCVNIGICCFIILIKLAYIYSSEKLSMPITNAHILLLIFTTVCLCYFIYEFVIEIRYGQSSLTKDSLKEAFDNLPSGVCFADERGRILLCNHMMNNISGLLTNESLQNANTFWSYVTIENLDQVDITLSNGERYTCFKSPYMFDGRRIYKYSAVNTTNLYALSQELVLSNQELNQLNQRLRHYNTELEDITKANERLELKVRLHHDWGRLLLASKYNIEHQINDESLRNEWETQLSLLQDNKDTVEQEDEIWSQLLHAAGSIGLHIEIQGNLPEGRHAFALFAFCTAECITNAVRHGNANTLYVHIQRLDTKYIIQYTNDGTTPKDTMVLGGGLSSLATRIEKAGGKLEVISNPFAIQVEFPVESEYIWEK